ncbi:MAG: hypothetical protein ABIJ26_05875 [Candidatus Margulisiibacteriota bacterium]|nr:hypothetical protein [Candidatus Margulisiibacteriota bacterium]
MNKKRLKSVKKTGVTLKEALTEIHDILSEAKPEAKKTTSASLRSKKGTRA